MQTRLDLQKASPAAFQALLTLEHFIQRSSKLESSLLALVRLRASQMNGCAYCLDMHSQDARAEGETEQRLYTLNAWRDTPFFTDRERAALAWAEAVTDISGNRISDGLYQATRQRFSEEELFNLTLAVAAINSWNRLCVAFEAVPGTYQPTAKKHEGVRQ